VAKRTLHHRRYFRWWGCHSPNDHLTVILSGKCMFTALKILSRISVAVDRFVRVSVRPVCSGKWLVGPNSTSSTIASFFIRLGKIDAATEFRCAGQMNRARGGRVLERRRVAEHCDFFVSTSWSINRFRVLARLARS
jgi:hypothetical protein